MCWVRVTDQGRVSRDQQVPGSSTFFPQQEPSTSTCPELKKKKRKKDVFQKNRGEKGLKASKRSSRRLKGTQFPREGLNPGV